MDVTQISEANMATLNAAGYTAEDLGMLAQSEIDSLLAVDSGDGASDIDPHDKAAADQEALAAQAAGNEAAARAAADANKSGEQAAADTAAFVPQFNVDVPADTKTKLDELRALDDAKFKDLMDGVIDAEEYRKEKRKIEDQVDTLKTTLFTAAALAQANIQSAEQAARAEWNRAEASAMNSFKEEGLDYKGKPALLAAYNTHLKALGDDPKNERRDASWFLSEAHRLTKADLGIVAKPGAKKDPVIEARGVDDAEMPPTLRNVPIAGSSVVQADEFAHMRNLDGIALERAHAALTEAQRDRWMNS